MWLGFLFSFGAGSVTAGTARAAAARTFFLSYDGHDRRNGKPNGDNADNYVIVKVHFGRSFRKI